MIAVIVPDAHEKIDAMLPDIIEITESDFQSLNQPQLGLLTYY
ncbi:hypothetical protein QPK14_01940 [Photorhabdus temperata subsp. temperata]